MYDRGSKNFLGFNRRKAIIKQQNAIDDQVYGSLLNTKLAENKKEIDYKGVVLYLHLLQIKLYQYQNLFLSIYKYESETGVKIIPCIS